jgi:hypothetical protein
MDPTLLDTAGILVAMILTLFVFSYLLGDNFLFRLAENLFVGVAIGYAVVVAFYDVLVPKLFRPLVDSLTSGDWQQALLLIISLAFGLLLLLKPAKRLSWLGSLSVALLLGVGAAVAIGGALLGTLLPQIGATADVTLYGTRYGSGLALFSGILLLVGTTAVVLHFHFGTGGKWIWSRVRGQLVRTWGGLGRWFIAVTFGAILATTFLSTLTLLIGRVEFLVNSVRHLVGGGG